MARSGQYAQCFQPHGRRILFSNSQKSSPIVLSLSVLTIKRSCYRTSPNICEFGHVPTVRQTFQYPYTALPQSALTQGLDRHELLSLGLRYSALVLKNCFHEERLMAHTPSPSDWQTLYVAAMMEADKGMLPTRVNEAEAAIFSRLQELSSVKTCEERTALDDAIRVLRVLKREQLNFPDWT